MVSRKHKEQIVSAFIAGGNWNNGAQNGVFAVNGNNARSNSNDNQGFRAAYPHRQIQQTHGFAVSTGGIYKGSVSFVA
ncbi:MAG: hypothetical protein IK093_16595 [Ruminiclostridium sp.]|nr:hypothetical protein [Ruminiclostridium sp.]